MASDGTTNGKVPLALWLFVAGQALAGVIWGATISERVADIDEQVELREPLVERFFRMERDMQLTLIVVDNLKMKIDILEEAVARGHPLPGDFQNIIPPR